MEDCFTQWLHVVRILLVDGSAKAIRGGFLVSCRHFHEMFLFRSSLKQWSLTWGTRNLEGTRRHLAGYVKFKKKLFHGKHWIIMARFRVSDRRRGCKDIRFETAISLSLSLSLIWFFFAKIPLCGLEVRVPGSSSRGPGLIPGATRFSEKQWVWNGFHTASCVQFRSYLDEKIAAPV
jgi:hypothetical protein